MYPYECHSYMFRHMFRLGLSNLRFCFARILRLLNSLQNYLANSVLRGVWDFYISDIGNGLETDLERTRNGGVTMLQ